MKTKHLRLSAWLALLTVSGFFSTPGLVRAELGTAVPITQMGAGAAVARPTAVCAFATATKVVGHVVKAIPDSRNRILAGAQSPCREGDRLSDGTVVQTGKETDSFAELRWGNGKVTRIWKDSLVRIFCGRSARVDTICLGKGSLIFRKDHADPNDYWVETKFLQARIHGTTVRVQALPTCDKFLIKEGGPVQIKNKETGATVELTPGFELVVTAKATFKNNDKRFEVPDLIERSN
jgi:hypothetical protein